MAKPKLTDLLKRPIAFHRAFVPIAGSVHAALMLSQALYWSDRTKDDDGWFYKTAAEWEEETGMTRHEQDGARRKLKETGFWFEDLRGYPPKQHYRVDQEILLSQFAENRQSNLPKSGKLACRKPAKHL